MLWIPLTILPFTIRFQYRCLFLLTQIGLIRYTIILSGWGSSSKFASLGAIRTGRQRISYEIVLIFLLITPFLLSHSFSLTFVHWKLALLLTPLILIWLITILVECNRAPFDFREGESELISGFNIEYSSVNFTLLFLREYGGILAFSWLTRLLFNSQNWLTFLLSFCFLLFIRTSLPRYRYDLLIQFCWLRILPVRLFLLLIVTFL
jgi:NADH:ubiquinone oxidoreductase subunit H